MSKKRKATPRAIADRIERFIGACNCFFDKWPRLPVDDYGLLADEGEGLASILESLDENSSELLRFCDALREGLLSASKALTIWRNLRVVLKHIALHLSHGKADEGRLILWDNWPLDEKAAPPVTPAEAGLPPQQLNLNPSTVFGYGERNLRVAGGSQIADLTRLYPGKDPFRPDFPKIRACLLAAGLVRAEEAEKLHIEDVIDKLELWKLQSNAKDAAKPRRQRSSLPPLSPRAFAVRELLRSLPQGKAMTGPDIIAALYERDRTMNMDMSTFTSRIVPELKPYGLRNKPRIGYYLEQPEK